ncbi:MAG: 3'-5' exonuclease [Gammaproteobacteria bacterium]|nr:3'-5' exonuclease [Gammaproteobacteria bacterium]MCP5136899.1 3'-5' exonuclease [Gammaproteobacteria bacterium]
MGLLDRFRSLDSRRRTLLERAPAGPLKAYYSVPFVSPKDDFRSIEYTALDFETTGLSPLKHELLSFGLINMSGTRIDLGSAQHQILRPKGDIPEASATVHEIRHQDTVGGIDEYEALLRLLSHLAGRVMVVHYHKIELGFLNAACQRHFGIDFLIPTIDTLQLAHRWIEGRNLYLRPSDLRLFNLARRFNLPIGAAHNALSDAVLTLELFLALTAQRLKEAHVPIHSLTWN